MRSRTFFDSCSATSSTDWRRQVSPKPLLAHGGLEIDGYLHPADLDAVGHSSSATSSTDRRAWKGASAMRATSRWERLPHPRTLVLRGVAQLRGKTLLATDTRWHGASIAWRSRNEEDMARKQGMVPVMVEVDIPAHTRWVKKWVPAPPQTESTPSANSGLGGIFLLLLVIGVAWLALGDASKHRESSPPAATSSR